MGSNRSSITTGVPMVAGPPTRPTTPQGIASRVVAPQRIVVVALGVASLAATSLAAMVATSELLAESFDRPVSDGLVPAERPSQQPLVEAGQGARVGRVEHGGGQAHHQSLGHIASRIEPTTVERAGRFSPKDMTVTRARAPAGP